MKEEQISVVVTVYNVESYLDRCIDSIRNQTYQNIEIILVDDGSSDDSLKICNGHKLVDERIKVVQHSRNLGLVTARKTGVMNSNGSYLCFVDADDWIELDLIERLANYINQDIDVITGAINFENQCGYILQVVQDSFACGIYDIEKIRNIIIPEMLFCYKKNKQGIVASACGKLFRIDTLRESIKDIDEKITFGEDAALVYSIVSVSKNICITHEKGYHYIQYDGSMIHTYNLDSFEKIYRLYQQLNLGISSDYKNKSDQINKYVSVFLNETVKGVFNISNNLVVYVPPYEIIPKGSKVVIYGAGDVGRGFCGALSSGDYVELVGWVDKNCYGKNWNGIEVLSTNSILRMNFDYILIAISKEGIVEMIKKELEDMGIDRDVILWKSPASY